MDSPGSSTDSPAFPRRPGGRPPAGKDVSCASTRPCRSSSKHLTMHYITHALSPLLALLDTGVRSVTCRGAGMLTHERSIGDFDNPYPTEVGLFALRNSNVLADVTMSFFQTGRS